METKLKRLLANLWFDWILLTIVYIVLLFIFGLSTTSYILAGLVVILGIFVPFGVFNFVAMFSPHINTGDMQFYSPAISYAFIYIIPLFFLVMFSGSYIGKKYITKPWLRFVFNLVVLLLLTIGVDLILWKDPAFLSLSKLFSLFKN